MAEPKTTKPSSWPTRTTAAISEATNLLTFLGNAATSISLAVLGGVSLIGGWGALGSALVVSAITHGMLARSARRAQKTSRDARRTSTMSGLRSLRHLFGSAARLGFAPVLLGFNMMAAIPFAAVDQASHLPQNTEDSTPGKSPQTNKPLEKGEVLIALPKARPAAPAQFSL